MSVLISEYLTHSHPTMAYYFTPARAFELLIGAICATGILPQIYSKKYSNILSILGLSLIAYCLFASLPIPTRFHFRVSQQLSRALALRWSFTRGPIRQLL